MKKTILVTGGAKGIGYEVARQYAARGCEVILTTRNAVAGKAAAAKLTGEVRFLAMDVSDAASVNAAVGSLSRLDVLVNNAGILLDRDGGVLDLSEDLLRETLETNALGPLRVARAAVPLLRKSREPRIINVSSGGGQLSDPSSWAPAYCISKTTLNAVTVQLAAALPNFAVNAVCPGWVRTDMGGTAAPRSVEEGADTIVWLGLDAPQSLTGRFLRDHEEIAW